MREFQCIIDMCTLCTERDSFADYLDLLVAFVCRIHYSRGVNIIYLLSESSQCCPKYHLSRNHCSAKFAPVVTELRTFLAVAIILAMATSVRAVELTVMNVATNATNNAIPSVNRSLLSAFRSINPT